MQWTQLSVRLSVAVTASLVLASCAPVRVNSYVGARCSANLLGDLREVFYFVPLLCALQLQRSGEYLAALDWFQTVYAYHLPPGRLDKLPGGHQHCRPANRCPTGGRSITA